MSESFDNLEKRLENLRPTEQEVLAGKILEDWQAAKRGDSMTASPRTRGVASLSIYSACAGAIVGAAAMFLGMTFLVPPKIEIREIVREVPVEVKTETNVAANRRSTPAQSVSEIPAISPLKAKKKWENLFASNAATFRDLDAILADGELLARQTARYESNAGSASSGFARPQISPDQYREILRDLKL
jgi:hypothetical protein